MRAVENLHGANYVVACDKLFVTPALAISLLEQRIRLVGPVKYGNVHRFLGPNIRMSTAKKAKPSTQNPRGKITKGHTPNGECHIFGFMDSSLVYFLSTYQGYTRNEPVYPKYTCR